MTIVAALYDPSTVLVADDLADVVTPDDDRANGWATGIWQRRRAPIARHGHPGQAYRTGLALADGFAERLIGSIRRECVDHIIVLGEMHLRRILKSYADYHNSVRTHRSSNKDAPVTRPVRRTGVIS